MKASASVSWGADRTILMKIYKATVLSKIQYGAVAYGSACKSLLNRLEVVQNIGLRIISGALRSTSILALRGELSVCSVLETIQESVMRYFIRASYFDEQHLVKVEVLNDLEVVEGLHWRHKLYKIPAVIRANEIRLKLNLPLIRNVTSYVVSPIPPWIDLGFEIKSELCIKLSKKAPPSILKRIMDLTLDSYNNFVQIFTDGSKMELNDELRVGGSFYVPHLDYTSKFRMRSYH